MSDSAKPLTPDPARASEVPPSPDLFLRTASGYQHTAAIKGAIDLGLFTAVAEGNRTTAELARACQASERGIRILSDHLCLLGFLTKDDGRYSLTRDSAIFLDRNSPAYIGGVLDFLLSPQITEGYFDVAAVVRHGGTLRPAGGALAPEHPVWKTFARSMMPMMAPAAPALASLIDVDSKRPLKVLDIAAGHGLFGIAFASRNPNVRVVAQDWPNVLEVAEENAQAAGITDRYTLLPGSAFEVEFGTGYDVVLLTNFLHHFDVPTCEALLKKVHAALADGGTAVALEFVTDDDRTSPPVPAAFALVMLTSTPGGDAYTFEELKSMFTRAGFSDTVCSPLHPTPEKVIISKK